MTSILKIIIELIILAPRVQRGIEILEENKNELSENATSLLNNIKSVFEKIYSHNRKKSFRIL